MTAAGAPEPALERRVRWLDRLFRWGLHLYPGTAIGRPVLRDLIHAYARADAAGRDRLRTLLADCEHFAGNVALPRPVESTEAFGQHLLHFSLIYAARDPRDSHLWLGDLCQEALAAGVAIEPPLRQVAELSPDDGDATWSARAALTQALQYAHAPAPRRQRGAS